MYDKFPEKLNIGNVQYIRADKVEEAVMAVAGSAGAGGEEVVIQEVCPVYRLAVEPLNGRYGQIANLAISFRTMPVTRLKPGMKVALRIVNQ